MQAIGFYIALPFIYLIALLPFPIFYGVSDVVFAILYHLLGYRKKVVMTNLRNSFPEKSEAEIQQIAKRFYRYLVDLFLETFKTLVISRETALKHCKLSDDALKLFDKYAGEGKSVIIVMGHYGNWEWAGNAFALQCKQRLYVIYHPIRNPYFNRLMYGMRTRFGNGLYAMKDTMREMVKNRAEVNATAFIADQTPSPEGACWLTFLNQDTPVFLGTERIAKKLNYPVIYVSVKRLRRGYYQVNAELLFEDPASAAEFEITRAHTRRLEADIIADPAVWLWSHRRWKHKRPVSEIKPV